MKFWLWMYVNFLGVRWSSSGRILEARIEVWEAAEVVCSARMVLR